MRASDLKIKIKNGAMGDFSHVYRDTERQAQRYIAALDEFIRLFGDGEVQVLSVPGRSEILGNHTDHNRGCVLAGAVDRDAIAVVARCDSGVIELKSEGYEKDTVLLSDIASPQKFENYSSASLIAGVAHGFSERGYSIGGFRAYLTSDVLRGSGISSSAAFEVMIGNIFNYLYNNGAVSNVEIAKLAQYAENVYFGKPCGLMDQMACAVGGFVFMDFADPARPDIEPISFSLYEQGYTMCIVNTGGNHADLNDDYASVPGEMKAVAALFGKEVLRGVTEAQLIENSKKIRESEGDRALLRSLHFVRECERVEQARKSLLCGDGAGFFDTVNASGSSSFKYLQNVYTVKNVAEQGLSLALAITESMGDGVRALRVHGGGFAGTVQCYIKNERVEEYTRLMDSVFGAGSVMCLNIRPLGATKIF